MRSMAAGVARTVALAGLASAAGAAAMGAWIDHCAAGRCYADAAELPRRDVAIILGAKVHPNGTPSAALEDRLAAALEAYRAGAVDRLLVTGDGQAAEYDEPRAMRSWLRDRGIAADSILVDPFGLRTLDSMQRAAQVYGVASATICTQRFHLPRAVFLARRAGIDAVGLVADRRYAERRENQVREFVAKAVAFVDSYVLRRGARHLN